MDSEPIWMQGAKKKQQLPPVPEPPKPVAPPKAQARTVDLAKIDRIPPHSLSAEQGVLGCILLSPTESLDICIEKFHQGHKLFYDLRHQQIYELLARMHAKPEPIDLITVQQRLKDVNQLEAIGGLTYLAALQDAVPSAANLSYYLEIVREKFMLRSLLQACTSVVGEVYESEDDAEGLLDVAEKRVMAVRESVTTGGVTGNQEALERLRDRLEGEKPSIGLISGFVDLDKKLGGFVKQQLAYFAGIPNSGKTTLALNIASHAVFTLGLGIGVYSFETSHDEVLHSMICNRGQVDSIRLRDKIADPHEIEAYVAAHTEFATNDRFIKVCEDGSLNTRQMLARGRRWKKELERDGLELGLLVCDYLQLIKEPGKDRLEKLENASMGCQLLAKELDVPMIVISAFTNEVGKDGKRPTMYDMKGSGQMTYDGKKVLLLHSEEPHKEVRKVNVNLAKNKGKMGRVDLTLHANQCRFETRKFDED